MIKTARMSPCTEFRYALGRTWDENRPMLPIIMLNPSVADSDIDDRTICRCMDFAKREGFGGILVANLFAFRATKPKVMLEADDPHGPEGNAAIEALLKEAAQSNISVLCAWGADGVHRGQDAVVIEMAKQVGAKLVCLGNTKHGHPKHPLYVDGADPFVPFGN